MKDDQGRMGVRLCVLGIVYISVLHVCSMLILNEVKLLNIVGNVYPSLSYCVSERKRDMPVLILVEHAWPAETVNEHGIK